MYRFNAAEKDRLEFIVIVTESNSIRVYTERVTDTKTILYEGCVQIVNNKRWKNG